MEVISGEVDDEECRWNDENADQCGEHQPAPVHASKRQPQSVPRRTIDQPLLNDRASTRQQHARGCEDDVTDPGRRSDTGQCTKASYGPSATEHERQE